MYEKDFRISYLLDYYGNILTEKQRNAMDMYYNADLSLAEIADHTGITRQGVRDAIKRGEETLLELEEKLGFAKMLEEHKKAFETIYMSAKNIKISKTSLNYYRILDDNVDQILKTARDNLDE